MMNGSASVTTHEHETRLDGPPRVGRGASSDAPAGSTGSSLALVRRLTLVLLLGPPLLLVWLWTALALHFTAPLPPVIRTAVGFAYLAGTLLGIAVPRRRWHVLGASLAVSSIVLVWFWRIAPRNDRDWPPETDVLPSAELAGDLVTVRRIRNFEYRAEQVFDVRYYDKTFDLTKIRALDLLVCYWTEDDRIAHTMLSWDFGGTDVLCLSVESRREMGERFGPLPGMFKQYEIIYVLGDERDLVRLRTNYRGEDVYLFRTEVSPADARRLLVRILDHANSLHERPQFYRTLGRNCTTSIVDHINAIWPNRTPYTEKILMNGYAPEQGYDRGMLKSDLPFHDYKRSCNIVEAARAAGRAPDFCRRIRAHVRR